jgi:hypothetical protein
VNLEVVTLKADRGSGHVETPNARPFGTDFLNGFVETLDEIVDPPPQGEGVVLAKTLDVAHFKAVRLEQPDQRAHLVKTYRSIKALPVFDGPRRPRAICT